MQKNQGDMTTLSRMAEAAWVEMQKYCMCYRPDETDHDDPTYEVCINGKTDVVLFTCKNGECWNWRLQRGMEAALRVLMDGLSLKSKIGPLVFSDPERTATVRAALAAIVEGK